MKQKFLILIIAITSALASSAADLSVNDAAANKSKKFTLVIDAGHGGHDAGAVGALTKEKTINLNVALAFGRLVEQHCPDVKVIYTRKTDVFIPLHTRADIANKNKADLFISIHTNALPKGHISRGMETYTLGMHRAADNLAVAKRENEVILYEKDYRQRYQGFDPNSSESYIMFEFIQDHNMAQSVELAKFVQRRTCATAGRQNKGVKQAGFLVLRETSMPSCLIELGFISTSDEERFLHSQNGVSLLGQGIYQAFLDYKRKYAPSVSVPYKPEPQPEVTVPEVLPPTPQPQAQQEPVKESKRERRRREKAEQETREAAAKAEQEVREAAAKAEQETREAAAAISPSLQGGTEGGSATSPSLQGGTEGGSTSSPSLQGGTEGGSASSPSLQGGTEGGSPIFKVQILAASTQLKPSSPHLKGETQVEYFQEGGMYKYTVGSSTDYNAINQLRKQLAAKFPQAFVIAFKNGQKTDVRAAIQEFMNNKKKK
jgi:N-acetylmuramoyl-L-alanine amidase